jgi:hypothetical protein
MSRKHLCTKLMKQAQRLSSHRPCAFVDIREHKHCQKWAHGRWSGRLRTERMHTAMGTFTTLLPIAAAPPDTKATCPAGTGWRRNIVAARQGEGAHLNASVCQP